MLGLVAEDSVIVADNAANQADCTIQGNIFARTGSLTAQNYDNGVLRGRLTDPRLDRTECPGAGGNEPQRRAEQRILQELHV